MKRKIYPILFVFLLIFITDVFAENNLVYSLTLRKWSDGTLNQEGIRLIEGSAPNRIGQNDIPKSYTLKVISNDNEVLYSFKFEIDLTRFYAPPKEWFDETGNQIYFPKEQTLTTEEDQVFVLTAPYFRNAKNIEIYDYNNQLVLTVDVSEYSLPPKKGSKIVWITLIILIAAIIGFFGYKNKEKITGVLKSKPGKRLETKTVNVKKSPSKTWKIIKIILIIVLILVIIFAFNAIHTYLDMRSIVLSHQEASRLAINP